MALEEVVRRERLGFFASVDYIVISDNLWLSRTKPALTYGSRGNSYFTVEVLGGHEVLGSRGSSPPRGHGALGPGSSGGLWHVHFGGIHSPLVGSRPQKQIGRWPDCWEQVFRESLKEEEGEGFLREWWAV